MRRIDTWIRALTRLAIVATALGFSACSLLPAEPPPAQDPEPVQQPVEIPVIPPPPPTPAPTIAKKETGPAPIRSPLAIVLTSAAAAYTDVAAELMRRFEDHEVYNLAEDSRPPVTILRLINDSDSGVVVAIGHRAAVSSVALANKPVVFSQVFNYEDLLTDNSRGVSSLAPLDAQLAAWKDLDPSLSRIGMIIGAGHDELLAEAKTAAEAHDIELLVHIADSDQETLFMFKRMIRDIDGYWLFPDNRVLSPRALRQIIDTANRLQVPVLAPTESMLAAGADVSVSSVAENIAEIIARIVRQIEAGNLLDVPAITPLSDIRVVVSDKSTGLRR